MNEREIQELKKEIRWIEMFKGQILFEPELESAFKKTYPEAYKLFMENKEAVLIKYWPRTKEIMQKTIPLIEDYWANTEAEKWRKWEIKEVLNGRH